MKPAVGLTPEKNCAAMIADSDAVKVEVVPLEHGAERACEDHPPFLGRHRARVGTPAG